VDLSERMVQKARERGCYDSCSVGELVEHLEAALGARREAGAGYA
jgi:predicted TPR repeat methyltransferase